MYGYIYLTTNLINGKKYIGKHKSSTFDESYKGSGTALTSSFKKYGFENFSCIILKECDSLEELNEFERYYTQLYDAVKSRDYYNLKEGGDGGGAPGCRYMTNGTINKKVFPEEFDYYLNLGYWFGGPSQTPESVEKRASSNRGKKHPTAGPNISKSLLGKPLSKEHRKKLSDAKKNKPAPNRKSIRCVETGQIFESIHHAVEEMHFTSAGNICMCLKGKRSIAFGYHWEYVN